MLICVRVCGFPLTSNSAWPGLLVILDLGYPRAGHPWWSQSQALGTQHLPPGEAGPAPRSSEALGAGLGSPLAHFQRSPSNLHGAVPPFLVSASHPSPTPTPPLGSPPAPGSGVWAAPLPTPRSIPLAPTARSFPPQYKFGAWPTPHLPPGAAPPRSRPPPEPSRGKGRGAGAVPGRWGDAALLDRGGPGTRGRGEEAGIDPRRRGGGQGVEDAAPSPTSDLGGDALPGPELETGGVAPCPKRGRGWIAA